MDVDLLGDLSYEAIMTMLIISAPVMLVALVSGLIVAIFQALTQIQEMTLTFVPKIILVMLALIVFTPFMLDKLLVYMELIVSSIVNIP